MTHFGHHVPDNLHTSKQYSAVVDQDASDLPMPLSLQDHHDHLPSCFHVVVIEAQQQLDEPILHSLESEQNITGLTLIQSPHLSGLNPPPVLTPIGGVVENSPPQPY